MLVVSRSAVIAWEFDTPLGGRPATSLFQCATSRGYGRISFYSGFTEIPGSTISPANGSSTVSFTGAAGYSSTVTAAAGAALAGFSGAALWKTTVSPAAGIAVCSAVGDFSNNPPSGEAYVVTINAVPSVSFVGASISKSNPAISAGAATVAFTGIANFPATMSIAAGAATVAFTSEPQNSANATAAAGAATVAFVGSAFSVSSLIPITGTSICSFRPGGGFLHFSALRQYTIPALNKNYTVEAQNRNFTIKVTP